MFQKDKKIKLSPTKYRKLCEYIMKRDEMCVICKSQLWPEAHHVIFRSNIRLDTPRNLVRLCMVCHGLIHKYEIELPGHVVEMLAGEPERLL